MRTFGWVVEDGAAENEDLETGSLEDAGARVADEAVDGFFQVVTSGATSSTGSLTIDDFEGDESCRAISCADLRRMAENRANCGSLERVIPFRLGEIGRSCTPVWFATR